MKLRSMLAALLLSLIGAPAAHAAGADFYPYFRGQGWTQDVSHSERECYVSVSGGSGNVMVATTPNDDGSVRVSVTFPYSAYVLPAMKDGKAYWATLNFNGLDFDIMPNAHRARAKLRLSPYINGSFDPFVSANVSQPVTWPVSNVWQVGVTKYTSKIGGTINYNNGCIVPFVAKVTGDFGTINNPRRDFPLIELPNPVDPPAASGSVNAALPKSADERPNAAAIEGALRKMRVRRFAN